VEPLNSLYLAVAGIFLFVTGLLALLFYFLTRPAVLRWFKERLCSFKSEISGGRRFHKARVTVIRWIDDKDRRLRRALKWKVSGLQYSILLVLVSAGSFLFCAYKFKNLIAAVLFASASVLLVEEYLRRSERMYRNTMSSQMATAVRLFTSEFARTPQVERAVAVVAANCPPPLGSVFKKAAKALMSGKPKEYVFSEMEKDMNFGYGLMFVELMRESDNNKMTVPLFHELEAKITATEELERENREKVDGEVNLSLIMLFSPVVMYLFLRKAVPESYDFLVNTPFGRLLVCSVFISALLWAFLARLTERVDA